MRARQFALVLVGILALGAVAAAQERGKTKAQGKVIDETGKPLADVIVAAVMDGQEKPFQQAKTNNKGEWSISNMPAGKWKFYFGGKEGLQDTSVDAQLGDGGTATVPEVKLGKPGDHNAFINAEIQRAGEMMQTRQPGEARKVYEGLIAKYPDAQAPFRAQLHGAIAQSYASENQLQPAIDNLKKAIELDASNSDLQLVLGEMLMQTNQKAEGEKVLMAIDISKVRDPFPYMNIVISKINEQKADEALVLIGKLMAQFPNENALNYYRGRANLAAKKMPEAKADLEKFVAAAPADARELPDAKKILEQMKDIK